MLIHMYHVNIKIKCSLYLKYIHESHNIVVNDNPYMWWWCHKILKKLKNSYCTNTVVLLFPSSMQHNDVLNSFVV